MQSSCWLWAGNVLSNGYAKAPETITRRYGIKTMHRFMYMYFSGELESELVIDHICNVSICINPEHLQQITSKENVLRSSISPAAINSKKTHCPRGHPYSHVDPAGSRRCRVCHRDKMRIRQDYKGNKGELLFVS